MVYLKQVRRVLKLSNDSDWAMFSSRDIAYIGDLGSGSNEYVTKKGYKVLSLTLKWKSNDVAVSPPDAFCTLHQGFPRLPGQKPECLARRNVSWAPSSLMTETLKRRSEETRRSALLQSPQLLLLARGAEIEKRKEWIKVNVCYLNLL